MASKLKRIRKYQWKKRISAHGFRTKMLTPGGRKVLSRRRRIGRARLAIQKR